MNRIMRWARPLLGFFLTCVFLYLMFRTLDWDSFKGVISAAAFGPLLLALALLASGYFMRIVRWWWMLRALVPDLKLKDCSRPFLVSIALNNLLPFRAGDVVRVVGFRNTLRTPAMRLLGTLFLERLLDLLVLLSFFFLGLLAVNPGVLPNYFIDLCLWIALAGIATLMVLLWAPHHVRSGVMWVLHREWIASRNISSKLNRWCEQFFSFLLVLRSKKFSMQVIVLSYLAWMMEGGVFAATAWALNDTNILGGSLFTLSTGTLATLIPSSPGYVGTFDYFTMLGAMAYGADRDSAAAYAILVHVVVWLPLTLVGLMYLLAPNGRVLWKRTQTANTAL